MCRLLWTQTNGLPATVYYDSHQVVHAVRVGGVPGRVEEAKLQGEDNTI